MGVVQNKTSGINGFAIKMIAVFSMLIDHIGAVILERYLYGGNFLIEEDTWYKLRNLDVWFRSIGRLAFPIYCYLIVEGFLHTRSVKKYMVRLGIFALLSEVPFDLAFQISFWNIQRNNVFFTLLFGLVAIAGIHYFDQRYPLVQGMEIKQRVLRTLTIIGSIFVPCGLAYYGGTDYGIAGVLSIIAFYLFRYNRMVATMVAIMVLGFTCGTMEFWAIFMLVPIYYYNGQRGPKVKWFFYLFYPVHLLILAAIAYALGLGM